MKKILLAILTVSALFTGTALLSNDANAQSINQSNLSYKLANAHHATVTKKVVAYELKKVPSSKAATKKAIAKKVLKPGTKIQASVTSSKFGYTGYRTWSVQGKNLKTTGYASYYIFEQDTNWLKLGKSLM